MSEQNNPVTIYKLDIMVIDHDRLGFETIKSVIENTRYPNRCISPQVAGYEIVEINWRDDHPINKVNGWEDAFIELFAIDE